MATLWLHRKLKKVFGKPRYPKQSRPAIYKTNLSKLEPDEATRAYYKHILRCPGLLFGGIDKVVAKTWGLTAAMTFEYEVCLQSAHVYLNGCYRYDP